MACLLPLSSLADSWQQGEDFFRKGDRIRAIQAWEDVLATKPLLTPQHIGALIHLAVAYQTQADYKRAEATLRQVLPLTTQKSAPRAQQVLVRSYLGDVLLALQKQEDAKKYLDEALHLASDLRDPAVLGHLYNNRCNLLSVEKSPETSATCAKAVEWSQQSRDSALYFQALNNQIWHLLQHESLSASVAALKTAMAQVRQQPPSYDKCFQMLGLGQLIVAIQKKYPFQKVELDSYPLLTEALQLAKKYQDKQMIAYANAYLGQLYEHAQRYPEALQLTRQAVFSSQEVPELLYLWEWQVGRILKAQNDLANSIVAHQRAVDILQPIRTALIRGQRDSHTAFQERIRAVYFSFGDVLLQQAKQSNLKEKGKLLQQARAIFEEMKKAELEDYFQDECVAARRENETSLDTLNSRTSVLYPVLLPDRTEVLYTLPDGIHQMVIPIEAEVLQKMALEFRQNLQSLAHFSFLKQATSLYDWLIAPLKADLVSHKIDTLVIVPDSTLRTIPFAAFFDKKEKAFLIQQFAIVVTPSLGLTEPRPLPREHISILLGGLSKSVQNFPALPHVPQEIREVGNLFEHHESFLDQTFSLVNTQKALVALPHNIVHIASHGQFDSNPNKTFILTYEDKLTMNRLEQLLALTKQRKEPVELLTLSACQTAVGDERAALGLAGVAIKAGARSALASLWFVNDESTARLVGEFYRQLQDATVSKAQALQKSQLALIEHPLFRHPAYWAPFLLIGNWL